MRVKPTEDLKSEHRGIERMLSVVEKGAGKLAAGSAIPPQVFLNAVDFFRNFADKCHHGKEESELFPALEKAGIPRQGGPLAVMLTEHDQGRAYIRSMSDAADRYAKGDAAARGPLAAAVGGYVQLLRGHIYKEDNVLFSLADSVLPAAVAARLTQAFESIEANVMGPGVHERYHQMLDDMEKQAATW
jgi:hemerythrin-like domain-containing protein